MAFTSKSNKNKPAHQSKIQIAVSDFAYSFQDQDACRKEKIEPTSSGFLLLCDEDAADCLIFFGPLVLHQEIRTAAMQLTSKLYMAYSLCHGCMFLFKSSAERLK